MITCQDWMRLLRLWKLRLDVYKRQALFPIVQGAFYDDLRRESAAIISSYDAVAVSYTHLDVYKRQAHAVGIASS